MESLERILAEDKKINEIIKKIAIDKENSEYYKHLRELNNYIFRNYCEKDYLERCEPGYCIFRETNKCRYIALLNLISQKFNVDLTKGISK